MFNYKKYLFAMIIAFPGLALASAEKLSNAQTVSAEFVTQAYQLLKSDKPQERSKGLLFLFNYRQADMYQTPIIIKEKASTSSSATAAAGSAGSAATAAYNATSLSRDALTVLSDKKKKIEFGKKFPFVLALAARNGDLNDTRLYLDEYNIDVNARDEYGVTGLAGATAAGHIKVVQFLIERGANPFLRGPDHLSALELAHKHKHLDLVNLLSDYEKQCTTSAKAYNASSLSTDSLVTAAAPTQQANRESIVILGGPSIPRESMSLPQGAIASASTAAATAAQTSSAASSAATARSTS